MKQMNIELVERIDGVIRRGETGNSSILSSRLGISRSTFFYYISAMKGLGAPIAYCRQGGYYYRFTVHFVCTFIQPG